jgi:HrpA-like RNA helicase
VLSTNVAETSVTIDDVGFVVDTARHKENRYDPDRRMSSLQDALAPRANLKQRRGRAGRVAPGVAFHLLTRHRADVMAPPHQEPEVRRVALEQLVLRIRALPVYRQCGTSAAEVCARLLEPPAVDAVNKAVEELVLLEAMTPQTATKREDLTPLGIHLSALPIDARLGKLILLGTIFGACDEALVVSAALSVRSPFVSRADDRAKGEENKKRWAKRSGVSSDHVAVLRAYASWDALGKSADRKRWCRDNMLGNRTLQQMAGLKRQARSILHWFPYDPVGVMNADP